MEKRGLIGNKDRHRTPQEAGGRGQALWVLPADIPKWITLLLVVCNEIDDLYKSSLGQNSETQSSVCI